METFIGFDSAWADNPRVPGAITIARFNNGVLAEWVQPRLVGFQGATEAILSEKKRAKFLLVAIDQPTIVPNATGCRPVERVAASLVSKLGGGVQPSRTARADIFGSQAPIWRFLRAIGGIEAPDAAKASVSGTYLIEVFPALALPSLIPELLRRGRGAKYNPGNKRTFELADWQLVAGSTAALAEYYGLAPLAAWCRDASSMPRPQKADQDKLDSAICLLIAICLRMASRKEFAVIGDHRTGYMVTPVSPETRQILQSAAQRMDVAFDLSWDPPVLVRPAQLVPAPQVTKATPVRAVPLPRHVAEISNSKRSAKIEFPLDQLRAVLIEAAKSKRTLTYGEVEAKFGYAHSQGATAALTSALNRLAIQNRVRSEPLLMALVVSKSAGMPGVGFWREAGLATFSESDRATHFQNYSAMVYDFNWR